MREPDPNYYKHPIDKWMQRHKRKFFPILIAAIPLAFAFYIALIAIAFEHMPHWVWLGGILSTIFVFMAVADLFDFWKRHQDD